MASTSVRVTALVLVMALALVTLQEADAQTYHYSNGWNSGKKRSGSALEGNSCSIRPQVLSSVIRILEDELSRIRLGCVPSTLSLGSNLPGVLQQLSSSMAAERSGAGVSDFK